MKKLGEYQNDINNLKQLNLLNYERIFKIHQILNTDKYYYFYNILRKIELPENIQSDLIQYRYIHSRTPLTTISYDIYGDIKSWWILLLLNKNLIPDLFWVNGGTQLKYLTEAGRILIYSEITKQVNFYGQHY